MTPCAGVKRCPENDCNYTVPIKEHHQCPRHNIKLVKHANCPVYFVYIEPSDRSYQGVADKVCKHQHPEKRAVEKEAFHLVVSAVQKVQTQQEVFCLFECLCGSQDINEVQSIVPGLNLSTC